MIVKKANLTNFRNHKSVTAELGLKNLVFGENGKGKTNLLDAIYMVLAPEQKISSPRDIAFNQPHARAKLEMAHNGTTISAEVLLTGEGKRYRENGKTTTERRGVMPVVYFGPKDLEIIAGPPAARRKYINQAGRGLSPEYAKEINDLRKILKNKNFLLRLEKPTRELEPWNKRLAQTSAAICKSRNEICANIGNLAGREFEKFGDGKLKFTYRPQVKGGDPEKEYLNLMTVNENKERFMKRAIYGPHLDDIEITASGVNLTTFGSHGQQRLVAFVLRLAQAKLLEQKWKRRPLILLDDLKSELDARHKDAVEELLADQCQVIATSTDACYGRGFKHIEL